MAVEVSRDNIGDVVKWLQSKGVRATVAGTSTDFPMVNFMVGSNGENAEIGEFVYLTGKGQAARMAAPEFHAFWVKEGKEQPAPSPVGS